MRLTRVLCLAALLLAACTPKAGSVLVAALLPPGAELMEAGMRAAAQQSGESLWVGQAGSLQEEQSRLAEIVRLKPAVLVIRPFSPKESLAVLQKAQASGIRIVCIESCLDQAGIEAGLISGPDRAAGYLSGDAVMEWAIREKGGRAVVALWPCESKAGCQARAEAFSARMQPMPGIEKLEITPSAGQTIQEALKASGTVDVIWAGSAEGAWQAGEAIRALGWAGQVVVFGAEMDERVGAMLSSGESALQSAAIPLAYQAGVSAFQAAASLARQPEASFAIPPLALLASREQPGPARDYLAEKGRWLLPEALAGAPGQTLFSTTPTPPICTSCSPKAHPDLPIEP